MKMPINYIFMVILVFSVVISVNPVTRKKDSFKRASKAVPSGLLHALQSTAPQLALNFWSPFLTVQFSDSIMI